MNKLSECPCCLRKTKVETRRRNTIYNKEELNYMTSCKDCFEKYSAMLDDMWKDYWNSV